MEQAIDDRIEDRAWLYYCCTLPYQDKKNRKTFGEILKELKRPKTEKAKSEKVSKELIDRYADIADLVRSR